MNVFNKFPFLAYVFKTPSSWVWCDEHDFLKTIIRKVMFCGFGTVLIVLCQVHYLTYKYPWEWTKISDQYHIRASSGMQQENQFVPFLYYSNLYPIASKTRTPYSLDDVAAIINNEPKSLVTEWNHTNRYGDHAKTYLYLPWAYFKRSAENPQVHHLHAAVFVLSLIALFSSMSLCGRPILAVILTLFLGSNPFQLFEVYARENIFSWPITIAIVLLAINLPFLFDVKKISSRWAVAAAVVSGIASGAIKHVRPEPSVMIAGVLLIYLICTRRKWLPKIGLAMALLLSSLLTTNTIQVYFNHKISQANNIVSLAGGTPFPGPRNSFHLFWHPIWCGLGDFDKQKGYKWDDKTAARYAFSQLKEHGVEVLPQWDGRSLVIENSFWDKSNLYYKTPYEVEGYNQVLKEKVLKDIQEDPVWYLSILSNRLIRIIQMTTPVTIRTAGAKVFSFSLRFSWPFFVVILVCCFARQFIPLNLVLYTIPLSATPLLVYSGEGTTYYNIFHLFSFALVVYWVILILWNNLAGKKHERSCLVFV